MLFHNLSARPPYPTTFAFGQANTELVDLAPGFAPAPQWSAWPMLADLSLDGDPDALVFVEAKDKLVGIENARYDRSRSQVEVLGGSYVFDEASEQGELRLILVQPPTLAFVPTHIEVVGWKQANALEGGLQADPSAVVHSLAALAPDGGVELRVPIANVELFMHHVYHFDLRAVRVEGQVVVEAGPSAVHAFTTPADLVDELVDDFGGGVELRVFVIVDGVEHELEDEDLSDRQLAPTTVQTDKIPEIPSAPNPFD